MLHKLRVKSFAAIAFALAIVIISGAGATRVEAATLQIQFTGLDLVYDGHDIFDAKSPFGGLGLPAESDPLISMDFLRDGTLIGSLSSNIWVDVAINNVGPLPVGGGSRTSGGAMFDILTNAGGWGLALDIPSMMVAYAGNQVALSGVGTASGILTQKLPFGLMVDKPINVLFILGTLQNVTTNGQSLTGFTASGTGTITAAAVPEPASMLLLGAGLLGIAGHLRRARR
jgi:hypothetical protein